MASCSHAGGDAAAGNVNSHSGDAESAEQHMTDQEAKLQQNLSSMMYIELLFWKNQRETEDVRDEYNWRVSLQLQRSETEDSSL